ncbi:CREB-regulated transcription coactivator 3 isoform X1 [Latimeria chalumnae]|uniref:CREB-regulated transcription coactivator 3 isoform X1 n=1 Tax=Latimeria chalumnae TaxID=7897 RepID=UPI0003C14209|nr:PREDICTED: CREB-regulated transcription coactivator 3 isoform X3 [Latimeria chalumnae]|eukprot:XP_005989790.1 PREDICTED: CREB-regulated transcription coactivator 3 isoform X3 [Latimeria chalumnae]
MSGTPASSSANPRKFSEKIALHNQKQAEETRAFQQLMSDLTLSRVEFQKLQQLRLAQSRAQYYGGSLPNVNKIGNDVAEFQTSFAPADTVRGRRHHGLVERGVPRNHLHSPHRRSLEKHGRQMDSSPYGPVYLSPPPDNSWRRHQPPWSEEKGPGLRLISALNRTNSDSALHTSALNPNLQDPFVGGMQSILRPPQRNVSLHDGDTDCGNMGDVFSFPVSLGEEGLLSVNKPLPKQLWEAKKVQSLSSRPKSCEVPGISIFPSLEQNPGLSHFQGTLNTGGSLPDLTNLHFPSPLPTPLDSEDMIYSNISGGNSTGNLPAAMTHLGISNSPGLSSLQSTLSNPSIQASLTNSVLSSSLNSHSLYSTLPNPSLHSSLRLSSLSNPSLPTATLSGSPCRRRTPVSPLTLSPGSEPPRLFSKQFSPTQSRPLPSLSQNMALDRSPLPVEPPPPYPFYQPPQQQSQQPLQQPVSPLNLTSMTQNSLLSGFFSDPVFGTPLTARQTKVLSQQLEQFNMMENPIHTMTGNSSSYFDPGSNLNYSEAIPIGLGGSYGNAQDMLQYKPNLLYSNCGGSVPNIILTDDSSSLSKDISSALAGVPEVTFDADNQFQLDDEFKIEPLTLDGLNMLSDPDMVLPDPSVEETFRSDRL